MEPWRYPKRVDEWLPLSSEQEESHRALRERLELDELDQLGAKWFPPTGSR